MNMTRKKHSVKLLRLKFLVNIRSYVYLKSNKLNFKGIDQHK